MNEACSSAMRMDSKVTGLMILTIRALMRRENESGRMRGRKEA